jgi:hypothetical protein
LLWVAPSVDATCQDGCDTNSGCTFLGDDALVSRTGQAFLNTAVGFIAGRNVTSGIDNSAFGAEALFSDTTGSFNTASGAFALRSNTTGGGNTASGLGALFSNATGIYNTAAGQNALRNNTTGNNNTASGANALGKNTTGSYNTANGANALFGNKTGIDNTANGSGALFSNRFGSHNTADGFNALYNNTTGVFNIALGDSAGASLTTGNSNIDIGNVGVAGESNTTRVGDPARQTATFIAGIRDVTTGNGDAITVVIDSAGQLRTMSSSRRFKKEIKPMDQTSESILGLKPVTFHYKSDAKSTPQFGLIAEDVEKVNPDLVARDAEGKVYTVRYEAVNAMLLNEFLKEHRKVQELEKQVEKLTAGLQKVSAEVEVSKPAPQLVADN